MGNLSVTKVLLLLACGCDGFFHVRPHHTDTDAPSDAAMPDGETTPHAFHGCGFPGPPIALTGALPVAIAIGDLDGDGRLDFVVANKNEDTIGVFLELRDGTFGTQTVYALGSAKGLAALALADVDSDGRPDVIATAATTSQVVVLSNMGDGRFALAPFISTGASPGALVVTDLDGDGKPDVVTAARNDHAVDVHLNSGGGMFSAPTAYPVDNAGAPLVPTSLAVGKLAGDAAPDLAIGTSTITILRHGAAGGTFGAATTLPGANVASVALAVADVNGDMRDDLLAVDGTAAKLVTDRQ